MEVDYYHSKMMQIYNGSLIYNESLIEIYIVR